MSSEVTAAQPLSESTLFARSLKKYQDTTFGPNNDTRSIVVAFDEDLCNHTCSKDSVDYNPNKCNYDEIMSELFKEGEVWLSRDLIHKAMGSIAGNHGWECSKTRTDIVCNRYGHSRSSARDFSAGELQANCTLIIKLKALVREKYFPASQSNKDQKKPSWRFFWDQPVQISKGTCTLHGGQCQPCRQNRVAVMCRAGTYIKKTPHSALYSLCNIAEHCGKLTSSAIKNVMRIAWPSQKPISDQNIFYLRTKVMKLMPTFRNSNEGL